MIYIKNYILNHFYQQYLVLLTMVPRNSIPVISYIDTSTVTFLTLNLVSRRNLLLPVKPGLEHQTSRKKTGDQTISVRAVPLRNCSTKQCNIRGRNIAPTYVACSSRPFLANSLCMLVRRSEYALCLTSDIKLFLVCWWACFRFTCQGRIGLFLVEKSIASAL